MSCLRTSGRSRSGYAAGPAPPRLRAFWARHAQCVRAAAKAGTGYSEMVEQALMLFIFQQDLGVQLQRALNVEQYDAATRIRERRQKVPLPPPRRPHKRLCSPRLLPPSPGVPVVLSARVASAAA